MSDAERLQRLRDTRTPVWSNEVFLLRLLDAALAANARLTRETAAHVDALRAFGDEVRVLQGQREELAATNAALTEDCNALSLKLAETAAERDALRGELRVWRNAHGARCPEMTADGEPWCTCSLASVKLRIAALIATPAPQPTQQPRAEPARVTEE